MAIWMAIRPGRTGTRVLATAGVKQTLLKANLALEPAHPRAVPALLEAVALWQGEQVRAALCVDGSDGGCDTTLSQTLVDVFDPTPLFRLDIVPDRPRSRERDRLEGMGDFRDLRQLLLFEVAQ
ncbi:MAG: hypothetical protein ACF8QF_00775 [Phycisphaerales bacterium]